MHDKDLSMSIVERIQRWYAAQCNGEWEHDHGVSIDTIDNPGWSVSIDLVGTGLESVTMSPYRQDNGEDDWVVCEIRDGKFTGNGDSSKLNLILEFFVRLLPDADSDSGSLTEMNSMMRDRITRMTENEIKGILRGHDDRNEELLRTLQTKGVALDKGRSVEHHFWANSQREAAMLAKQLYDRGFLVLAISTVGTEDGSKLWNVEAEVEQAPSVAASRDMSEELTRLAAQFDAVYDGWGTSI